MTFKKINQKKQIILIIIIVIALVIVSSWLFSYFFIPLTCQDGRGINTYFNKIALFGITNLTEFSILEEDIFASAQFNCGQSSYKIKTESKLKSANEKSFKEYLDNLNSDCQDCVLVSKVGWPFSGEIFKYSTNEKICGTGHRSSDENCINLTEP